MNPSYDTNTAFSHLNPLERLDRYDQKLSAVMPPDFKDWWQNSQEEWPDVAAGVIENLRKREEMAWEQVERLSPPQPVPVSERLPGPEDCDAEGNVWAWRRFDSEGDMDNGDFWCVAFCEWLEDEDCGFTHWLPASALPFTGES